MPRPTRTAPRLAVLSAGALAAALTLSACSGDSATDAAPAPASALPAPIASVVTGTDVGQFFVAPKEGTSKDVVDGAIAKLKSMEGVQSAELNQDGLVDVQFRGGITRAQREAAVKQMAALGEVTEGI